MRKRIRRPDRDYPTLILAERKRRGQTQAAAAFDLGTTVTTISNWECGVRRPCGLYQDAVDIWLVGKEPLTPHGFLDASTDPEVIRRWWAHWPDANIGIVTGAISGLVVLDIDRHGKSDGLVSLREKFPDFDPEAYPHVITGDGGIHVYFRHPGIPVKTENGLLPGVNMRGDGGFVIAPPSIGPSGKEYTWGPIPHEELPDMPPWLLKMVHSPVAQASDKNSSC